MRIVFICLLLMTVNHAQSQNASGYYITLTNDTVAATYSLKANIFKHYNLHEELPVIDSNDQTIQLKPADIKGFYIKKEGETATFFSMLVEERGQYFVNTIFQIPAYSVISYSTVKKWPDGTRYESKHYLFRKADGSSILIISDQSHSKIRKRLKEFFAEDEKTLTAMQGLFMQPGFNLRDMPKFIQRLAEAYKEEILVKPVKYENLKFLDRASG